MEKKLFIISNMQITEMQTEQKLLPYINITMQNAVSSVNLSPSDEASSVYGQVLIQPELSHRVLGRPVSGSDTCNGTHGTVAKSTANFNTNPYTLNINCQLCTYADTAQPYYRSGTPTLLLIKVYT